MRPAGVTFAGAGHRCGLPPVLGGLNISYLPKLGETPQLNLAQAWPSCPAAPRWRGLYGGLVDACSRGVGGGAAGELLLAGLRCSVLLPCPAQR
jgi:hypothetical protein